MDAFTFRQSVWNYKSHFDIEEYVSLQFGIKKHSTYVYYQVILHFVTMILLSAQEPLNIVQYRKRYKVSMVSNYVLKLGWKAARHEAKKPRDQP